MIQSPIGLFVDHDDNGEPYAGIEYAGGGVAVRMYLASKGNSATVRTAMNRILDELDKTKPKILLAKGDLNGGKAR